MKLILFSSKISCAAVLLLYRTSMANTQSQATILANTIFLYSSTKRAEILARKMGLRRGFIYLNIFSTAWEYQSLNFQALHYLHRMYEFPGFAGYHDNAHF